MFSPALIVLLPANRVPNKLAPNLPNNIPRSSPFCSFAPFLMVLLTIFINNPDSSKDLTIFNISFISSFKTINYVIPDPNMFLLIAASLGDAVAVNPNGIKTLLANILSPFPIKGNPFFRNGPKSLPSNPPDCPILCN